MCCAIYLRNAQKNTVQSPLAAASFLCSKKYDPKRKKIRANLQTRRFAQSYRWESVYFRVVLISPEKFRADINAENMWKFSLIGIFLIPSVP
jgi:hypothetical protein